MKLSGNGGEVQLAAFSSIYGDPGLAVTFKYPRWRSRRSDVFFLQSSANAYLSNFLNLQSTGSGFYKSGVFQSRFPSDPAGSVLHILGVSHCNQKPSHDRPY